MSIPNVNGLDKCFGTNINLCEEKNGAVNGLSDLLNCTIRAIAVQGLSGYSLGNVEPLLDDILTGRAELNALFLATYCFNEANANDPFCRSPDLSNEECGTPITLSINGPKQPLDRCQFPDLCDVVGNNNIYTEYIVLKELACLITALGGPSSREVLVNAATSILTVLRNANVNSTSVATELNTLIYDLQDYINGNH